MRNKRINKGENCMERIQTKAITDASDKKYISVLFLGIKFRTVAEKGNRRGLKRTLRSTAPGETFSFFISVLLSFH